MRRILNYCLVALFAAVALCACDDDDNGNDVPKPPVITKSSSCDMNSLALKIAQAEEYASQGMYVQCNKDALVFSAVNQKKVSLNEVFIKFSVSEKASVYACDANGNESGSALTSEASAIDISQGVAYLKVIAENGVNTKVYSVRVTSVE